MNIQPAAKFEWKSPHTLRYGKMWSLFLAAGGLVTLGLSIRLSSLKVDAASWLLLQLFSIFFGFATLVGIFEFWYGKVILDDTEIVQCTVFGSRKLSVRDIAGFEILERSIRFLPRHVDGTVIEINLYMSGHNEALAWAEFQNFANLTR